MKTRLMMLLLGITILPAIALAQDYPRVEIPLGFSFINVHPNLSPITSFNVFGGNGGVVFNFTNVIGIRADFAGYSQSGGLNDQLKKLPGYSGSVSGNVTTYLFGPQLKKHSGFIQPFGEALFGGVHTNAFGTILTDEGRLIKSSPSNNGFAMQFGGGVDIPVSHSVQIRPVEVDYLYTHFGGYGNIPGYSSHQNNFRYSAGFNFTFGRR
jgi:opacity protein-like surface antigen